MPETFGSSVSTVTSVWSGKERSVSTSTASRQMSRTRASIISSPIVRRAAASTATRGLFRRSSPIQNLTSSCAIILQHAPERKGRLPRLLPGPALRPGADRGLQRVEPPVK